MEVKLELNEMEVAKLVKALRECSKETREEVADKLEEL
jgi:hypothetical protein